MLFGYGDIQKIRYFIKQKNEKEQRVANLHLKALLQFTQTDVCRRIPLLHYFGEEYGHEKCNMCDNCLSEDKEKIDITVSAQKFLSCVKRTGERFGSNHIIDVLMGSKSKKVEKFGHQHLSTYDIGDEYSRSGWHYVCLQLLHNGMLEQDIEYGGLSLTPQAWKVMRGEKKFMGFVEVKQPKPAVEIYEKDYHPDLFELLRKKRKVLARNSKVPPYVIFSDKTLIEMAAYYPRTKDQLIGIHGVGAVKLKKYGDEFLSIIIDYCVEHDISPKQKVRNSINKTLLSKPKKNRYVAVGEFYNNGETIDHLMGKYNVKLSTILDHLYKYCMDGHRLKSNDVFNKSNLSKKEKQLVLNVMDLRGTEFLGPLFRECNGKIAYDELKIMRLYYMNKICAEGAQNEG